MRRLILICAAVSLAWCGLVSRSAAADPTFSAGQRDAIVKIVRDALKNDPSILREAVTALQADDETRAVTESKSAIVKHRADLVSHFGDPEAGNASGDVTIVEFYDPRCPYCRKMLPAIDALLAKDHGVRLVFKDIPVLGPASVLESRAIVAAQNQGAYMKMQAALMHNPATPSEDLVRQTAHTLGLNADQLVTDMKAPATSHKIQANLDLARELKVSGTPAFVIGDQMLPGAVDTAQLETVIAGARKHSSN